MKIGFFIFKFIFGIGFVFQPLIAQSIEQDIKDWEYRMVGDSVWKPAKVPGTIIDNLVDLSDIQNPLHPYYGDNENLYQWVGERDWEFRTKVIVDSAYLNADYTLDFPVLDLFADVYVDGVKWKHESAFSPFRINGVFLKRKRELRIVFHSTTNTLLKIEKGDSLMLPGGGRVYARKPQYEFGWDWAPKFVNMGIRKLPKLWIYPPGERYFEAFISNWELIGNAARLNLELRAFGMNRGYDLYTNVLYKGSVVEQCMHKISVQDNYRASTTVIEIKDPKLWWPNGMGKPAADYYQLDLRLTQPGDTQTIEHLHLNIALCKIKLIQQKDSIGESFYFQVNGERVFAKGANYVPDDSFEPGTNSEELIRMAATANMNMIRVWGGGIYPDDFFYEECMKNGIMVWQDFMFACGMYPGDEKFIDNIESEVDLRLRQLKGYNHIAVWCGNNENDEGWKNWGWQRELKYSEKDSTKVYENYVQVFDELLPSIVKKHMDESSYISSSPKFGWGRKESMTSGDSHYWGVWWGLESVEKFEEKVPRFMSEFGMQAMPNLATLKNVIPDSAMNFNSPKFKNHQKHPTGFKTLNHYLNEYLLIPEKMDDYAYATQVLQAYTLSTAISAQRRAMPYCMGSLLWQFNDCWPVTSWSIIDYDLRKKIGYDAVKLAFSTIAISIHESEFCYDVYIVNDSLQTLQQDLNIRISDFYGKIIMEKHIAVNVKENSSAIYYSLKKDLLKNVNLETVYMHVFLGSEYSNSTQFFYHFKKFNQLKLVEAKFKIEKESDLLYSIQSDVYAPYVWIDGLGYIGHSSPGNRLMVKVKDEDERNAMEALKIDSSRIKCLNSLFIH